MKPQNIKPILDDLVTLPQYLEGEPRATIPAINKAYKAGQLSRWSYKEIAARFPGQDLSKACGWTLGAMNTYFYSLSQLQTVFAQASEYVSMANMTDRTKAKLRSALAKLASLKQTPTEVYPAFSNAQAWGGLFQRNITLSAPEIALMDAIARVMRGCRTDRMPSWIGVFKRLLGMCIVTMHPGMTGRSYAAYFAWVNGPQFDLMTLVGSLGYDDLDDFATQLMVPIGAVGKAHKDMTDDGTLSDPSHPMYVAICSLRAQAAEGTADAVIGKATGIPKFREAVEMMAMIRDADQPSPDLLKIMHTLKLVQEAGLAFCDGQLIVVDKSKAEAFHWLLMDSSDPDLKAIVIADRPEGNRITT
jgi:hypothetical protein